MTDWGSVLISGLDYHGGLENASKPSSVIGPEVRGNGLLRRSNGLHVFQIQTSNFTGNVQIEATLDKDPNVGPWVAIPLYNAINGQTVTELSFVGPVPNTSGSDCPIQLNNIYSSVGQYAWLRANVSAISGGILQSIKVNF